MRSRLIIVAHTMLFFGFVGASLGVSVAIVVYPGLFLYLAFVCAVCMVGISYTWQWYGDCPLTVWEKRALKLEGNEVYQAPCIAHYARKWFRLPLRDKDGGRITLGFMLLPIIVYIISCL
jgi:hypothetical protein